MRNLDDILSRINLLAGDSIEIRHSLSDNADGALVTDDSGKVILELSGRLPDEYYIRIPEAFFSAGFRRIMLRAPAIWIGEQPAPPSVEICDHIACHLTNPLTGTPEARYGRAFVDMRDVYSSLSTGAPDSIILWHTLEMGRLSDEELLVARSAGCTVATPFVAPWAIGARKAGCAFSATVRVTSLS